MRVDSDETWDRGLRERLWRVAQVSGMRMRMCYWALAQAQGEVREAQRILLTPRRVAVLERHAVDLARYQMFSAPARDRARARHAEAAALLAAPGPRPAWAGAHAWVDARLGFTERLGLRRVVGASLDANPGHRRWSGLFARPARAGRDPSALADAAAVAAGLLPTCLPWRRIELAHAQLSLARALASDTGLTRRALPEPRAHRACARFFHAMPRDAAALVPADTLLEHTFEDGVVLVHPTRVALLWLHGED